MLETFGECPNNPHGNGHCDHTDTQKSTGGTYLITKCCWCGRTETTRLSLPEHGKHAGPL